MELMLASFMSSLGFTFLQILEMLVLVGMNFIFMGFLLWRVKNPIVALYGSVMTAMNAIPRLETSVKDLNKTLQEHIVQTDLRMEMGEERFSKLEDRITKLESKED